MLVLPNAKRPIIKTETPPDSGTGPECAVMSLRADLSWSILWPGSDCVGASHASRPSPSVLVNEVDDRGRRLLRLLFHDPMAGIRDDAGRYITGDEAHIVGHVRSERMVRAER
jgi:hypothetical protein